MPDNDEARFALGAVQFLQAIENLGQAFHRYGLNSGEIELPGLAGLPFFRLPVPPNPNPEKIDYEALRSVLAASSMTSRRRKKTLSADEEHGARSAAQYRPDPPRFRRRRKGFGEEAARTVLIAIGVPLGSAQKRRTRSWPTSMRATCPGSAPIAICSWRSRSFRSRTTGEPAFEASFQGSFHAPGCL